MRGLGLGLGLLVAVGRVTLSYFTDFNSWTPTFAALVVNDTTSSTGASGGDTMTDDPTTANHSISTVVNVVAGQQYTLEVTLAAGTWSEAYLSASDGITHSAFIDLSTGVVGTTANVVSVTSANAGLLNGYWKFTLKWIANTTGVCTVGIFQASAGSISHPGTGFRTIKIHTITISRP